MSDDKLIEQFMESVFIAVTVVICFIVACLAFVYWRWVG